RKLYNDHRAEFGLDEDSGWQGPLPGLPGITMVAQSHVFNANCADNDQLTAAEFEGRRQIRAMMDLLRKYGERPPVLASLPSYIGIRETRRFQTDHVLTEEEVLQGRRFPDAIANGTYRVDVHYPTGGGFIFKYLDGTQKDVRNGGKCEIGRWRPETVENPTFYQIPYRTMTSAHCPNLLLAGRMIGSDRGAFGAIRVMVNLNQVGEAAGEAACLALAGGGHVREISIDQLRRALADGGSRVL
ncbi:MAG: FAD-dependent oxidoreductase, partial [Kiritimatiellia bacterium]|nr:FAD-dependent oxidoreductase [Lentisphaerota bacterium]